MNFFVRFSVAVFAIVLVTSESESCPTIYTRTNWGATPVFGVAKFQGTSYKVIIKATQDDVCSSKARCLQKVAEFQTKEINKGEVDLDCSFLIGGDGNVYEGRGWGQQTDSGNVYSICVMGSFQITSPTSSQRSALENMLACGVELGKVDTHYVAQTPRDINSFSSNPGDSLYLLVKSLPRYQASELE